MPADYINTLRKEYVRNLVNAMTAAVLSRGQTEFTRGHALLSLLDLSKGKPKRYFSVNEVFQQAEIQGYTGGEPGIRGGLKALYSSGVVLQRGTSYKIHPFLRRAVKDHAPNLKGAITTAQA